MSGVDIKEHAAAVLTVLARLDIPADVLELLTHGNPDRNILPGALEAALSRAFDASKSESIQAAMAAERTACALLARYHSHHALWQGLPTDALDAFGIALAKRIESGIRERQMPKLPDIDAEKDAAIADLQIQLERHHHSFELRRKADMRAIKRWQEANPGNDLIWPDHADLCVWLMDRIAELEARS